ncbi:MAG: polysaccharide deacetylase family protein [Deltaproteobacteria bacterium]|nr:polysaccharide deacetylase family protein [Deltaproteobacteria bacterium]
MIRNARGLTVPLQTLFVLVLVLLFQGCALPPQPQQQQPLAPPPEQDYTLRSDALPDIKPVIIKEGDTLQSLAEKYLGSANASWLIARFNGVSQVTPGQEIIIPLEPFVLAGLTPNGYQTVPVLTYHNFSENRHNLMMVTRSGFESQMRYLKENGYTPITLDTLFDFLDFKKEIPEKSVVITIDDGWRGVYEIAYPILKQYGFPATLFVYPDFIGGGKKALDWRMLAELDKGGVDVQCHTKSHRDLNKIKEQESFQQYVSEIEKEIAECAATLNNRLNKNVRYLAYPYGEANNLAVAFLRKNGFRGAFTVKRDSNPFFTDHYMLNRSMIYGDFDLQAFGKNLETYSNEALR